MKAPARQKRHMTVVRGVIKIAPYVHLALD